MSPRARIASYGSAVSLILAGSALAILVGGGTGQILAFVLIALGLVAITALAFLEVGLSEDRERAARRPPTGAPQRLRRRPRPSRTRGHR